MVQDRRTHMRLEVRIPCTFSVDGIARPGEIIRLSMSGCFVASNNWYPCKGDEVTIAFHADQNPVVLEGKVTRVGVCCSKDKVRSGFAARVGAKPEVVHVMRHQLALQGR
jgi:hypothetical protein